MPRLTSRVARLLDKAGLKYAQQGNEFILPIATEVAPYLLHLFVDESEEIVVCLGYTPIDVPSDRRQEASLYLTLVNYGVLLGNFEMDLRDGEVRFKTTCHVSGSKLSESMLKGLVLSNVMNLDRFFPGLVEVALNDASCREALGEEDDRQAVDEPARMLN